MATKKSAELTPAQKAAATRAKNKAAKEAAAVKAVAVVDFDAVGETTVRRIDPEINNPIPPVNENGDIVLNTSEASIAATETVAAQLPPVVENVIDAIDDLSSNTTVQVTVSKVTPKIGAKAREIIYNIGIVLGIVGTVGPVVVAYLTGEAGVVAGSVVGIAYALSNALARLNLSKTADDLNKEKAASA